MEEGKRVFRRVLVPQITVGRKVDMYLSENLPDLIDEYKLATTRDIKEVDEKFTVCEDEIKSLEEWKDTAGKRIDNIESRVERLELKHGIKR